MNGALDRVMQSWADQLWTSLVEGAVAHPSATAAIDVDSAWMLDEWERELFERLLYHARGGSVRFVESSHGGGRSHFLHLLEARARTAGMATVTIPEGRQAAVWRDPLELYREIASKLLPSHSPAGRGLPSLLSSASERRVFRAELFPQFPTWGLALERYAATSDDRARRFLLGLPLETSATETGLHAGLSSTQALSALRCLLTLLEFCGERGLVVSADGDGTMEHGKEERATLEALRNLVDCCAGGELPGLLLVFAVLPEFREQVVPEYEALQQRLHNGFSIGPAGCLRPILILEKQRSWRASQGVDFVAELADRIHQLALRVVPELRESPAILRRNLDALTAELPWDEESQGAPRLLARTMARWFVQPHLPLDSSDSEEHAFRLAEFLEGEEE